MSISCKDLAEKLLLFRDGDLSPEETEHLRQHLHLCSMCVDLLQSYEEMVDVLGRLQPVRMPEGLLERLKRNVAGA